MVLKQKMLHKAFAKLKLHAIKNKRKLIQNQNVFSFQLILFFFTYKHLTFCN
jgi:hypothetical protein